MANTSANVPTQIKEIAERIHEMRIIMDLSIEAMAEKTEVTVDEYRKYENGELDFPFTFIHKCSLAFGVGMSDLLEGRSAKLSSYTVTRKGEGQETAKEEGIEIRNLAPMFRKKISEPYFVHYEYDEKLQNKPIHMTKHSGQEFDYVMEGRLKVQVGDNIEYLSEGDCIYYNSSTPHGMIAVDGRDCLFLAVVLPGDKEEEVVVRNTLFGRSHDTSNAVASKFVEVKENADGTPESITFRNEDKFNFAFDIVDAIAKKNPDKLAMKHISDDMTERDFTFEDIKKGSNQAANYFKSCGIKKGDRVMLVLKRHYQFWFAIIGLHKLGAIAIPATNQLKEHDFEYRFEKAGVTAIVCTADGDAAEEAEKADAKLGCLKNRIIVNGSREGWADFDKELPMYSTHFYRSESTAGGDDTMLMLFTSGTSGYPKIVAHSYKYALGHYITAKYWHGVMEDGLHFTISETGWGKSLWGKLYGQWLCGAAIFVYDFTKFDEQKILPMFAKYNITTFCAPATMLRMLIRGDLSKYDLSSIKHITTAGESLNPEVYKKFLEATGLHITEGYGQTELTLAIGNLIGDVIKIGSMGKASPLYEIALLDKEGNHAETGEPGEICINTRNGDPCGLFKGYYLDEEATDKIWHDGYYHTRDLAWKDEDGFYWYVGRTDDVIKSSGYRIGPQEIENVIMELPYVLECGVSPEPDAVRGQVVKASVVLVEGTKPSDELVKEIQSYVKEHTAPYKYPRIVVFRDSLPKTISGKIQRSKL